MKLPPMNALRAFAAVSRQGNVSKAAKELCVSQGAVSQQLRNLEDYFGRELFHRSANSITLTDDAADFAGVVQRSLQLIAEAADQLVAEKSLQALRISAPPTLVFKWLMPKLGQFYDLHPGISVVLDESLDLVTFKNDGFDAAIRFADGEFEDLNSSLLIKLKIHAVASPAYLQKAGYPESLASPRGHHLIDHYYGSKNISSQHVHWRDIVDAELDQLGVEHLVYPDGLQALTAAVQRQGIALVPLYLCEQEIADGDLEIIGDPIYEYSNRYYLVSPQDARPNPALENFSNWLQSISKAYRDDD